MNHQVQVRFKVGKQAAGGVMRGHWTKSRRQIQFNLPGSVMVSMWWGITAAIPGGAAAPLPPNHDPNICRFQLTRLRASAKILRWRLRIQF
jgi:hypothetical protein